MYRLGIWMIALALVFNGVPTYALDGVPGAPIVAALDHHADAPEVECMAGRGDVAVVASANCQSRDAGHDHLKCCPTCNVVSMLPVAVAVSVPFRYAPACFRTTDFGLVGHLVALDPDIPKSVV